CAGKALPRLSRLARGALPDGAGVGIDSKDMRMLLAHFSLWWLGYLALGTVAGVFAGMLGAGGGILIIPALTLALDAQGFPRENVLHVAIATAMATVMFTSLSSTRAHAIRNSVRWDIVR